MSRTGNTTVIDGKQFLVIDVAKIRVPLGFHRRRCADGRRAELSGVGPRRSWRHAGHRHRDQLHATSKGRSDTGISVVDRDVAERLQAEPGTARRRGRRKRQHCAGSRRLHRGGTGEGHRPQFWCRYRVRVAEPEGGRPLLPCELTTPHPSGNAAYTLAASVNRRQPYGVAVPSATGRNRGTGTSSDVRVDLYARLNDRDSRQHRRSCAMGKPASTRRPHNLNPRLPAGASNTTICSRNTAATIYFRAERVTGTGTFTTTSTDTDFWVKVNPVP
jgi:hypothetical protein